MAQPARLEPLRSGEDHVAPVRRLVGSRRSNADQLMCRILCIPGGSRARVSDEDAQRIFSVSMVLSGLRCLLSYVVLPVLLPAAGLAAGIGPYIGIPIGLVALVFDVKGIRRFWLANHRWRWPISAIYLLVIVLVIALMALDVASLAS
jgi:hypothetical protein